MSLNPSTNATMTGRVTAPDANYPYSSSKDESSPGAGDGTPYFKGRADDIFGMQQALLKSANITPSGNADTINDSEYVASIVEIASGRAFNYDDSGVANVYVLDIQADQQGIRSYFDGLECEYIAGNSNTTSSSADVNGLGAKAIINTSVAGTIVAGARIKIKYRLSTDDFEIIQTGAPSISSGIKTVTGTVAASVLTLGLAADTLTFRHATIGNGSVNTYNFSALSLIVPSGATLGTINTIQSRLILLAIDNVGTVELAVVNLAGGVNLDEEGIISTVAIDATADLDNVIYSTTARTNVPYRVVGFAESTQAVAGTWNTAPSTLQGMGGNALTAMSSLGHGQTSQDVSGSRSLSTTYYNTTGKPIFVRYQSASTVAGVVVTIGGVVDVGSHVSNTTFMVPAGFSYSIASASAVQVWMETR